MDLCQQRLVAEIDRLGSLRLMVLLREFEGWASEGNWSDLSFSLRHGDRIDRIAIVGPQRWRTEALMFGGADLRNAPVEFFGEPALSDARAGLSS